MKKSKAAAMLAAVTLSTAGVGLMTMSAAQASPAETSSTGPAASEAPTVKRDVLEGKHATVFQGDDWAYFNFEKKTVKVCDKENDDRAVYAYLRHRNDLDADVLYDNTKGCTTHNISSKGAYRYITVCESAWGPDWCRQPVVYMR
ncbi:hypothetical protein JOF56_008204 [Kibdelosporangium banguiense]|uniref:Secreted protein n=1 Tax=Kibdelosporangium banguiense TaxID=1365924 RepID=A0ABS4TV14_9PSEU|nr:hypothetical protein [Kibdelosporangium banguiense]MBP2327819.1 hypothetical protein [Kibdelosporangium banguiense]